MSDTQNAKEYRKELMEMADENPELFKRFFQEINTLIDEGHAEYAKDCMQLGEILLDGGSSRIISTLYNNDDGSFYFEKDTLDRDRCVMITIKMSEFVCCGICGNPEHRHDCDCPNAEQLLKG